MMGQTAIASALLLLAGACSTAQAPAPQAPADSPPGEGSTPAHKCDPANIQQFVAKQKSDSLERDMLRVSGASTVRWAPVGTAITMEYRFDRLTVFLDANNRVERISCS
ncbi:MAG: I78 family peptidase inhibitor [Sphingomicrobium sp.]